jgi:hypothetical protein
VSRVLIVSRTRMRHERVCVGGHDLDHGFRSLRLLRSDGTNMLEKTALVIGDIWELDFRDRPGVQPPHVEDVLVESGKRVDRVRGLEAFLRERVDPWRGPPEQLFDGHVEGTPSGTAYVPNEEPLPRQSTGYWTPDAELDRRTFDDKVRYFYLGSSVATRFSWVGMEDPPDEIPVESLVRVSLARLWSPPSAPAGYYVQISGAY